LQTAPTGSLYYLLLQTVLAESGGGKVVVRDGVLEFLAEVGVEKGSGGDAEILPSGRLDLGRARKDLRFGED
jgi:hypothetical protein